MALERFSPSVRRTDIMPLDEAQREASEITLGWHEPIFIADEDSGRSMRLRPHNNVKVFVAGADVEGATPYIGRIPMENGENYSFQLAGKKVDVKPIDYAPGRKRKFEITLSQGLTISESQPEELQTDQSA